MTLTSFVRSDLVPVRTPPRASRWSVRPPSPRFRSPCFFFFRGGILFELEWAETGLGRASEANFCYNLLVFTANYFKSIKSPVVLLTLAFLTFGFVCTGMFGKQMDMSQMDMGMMSSEHGQQCCTIGVAHHINSWKDIVLTLPNKTRDALMLLALSLALIFGYSWVSLWNRRPSPDLDIGRLRLYIREHPDLILFDHLKLAFARGILNPKIY